MNVHTHVQKLVNIFANIKIVWFDYDPYFTFMDMLLCN